MAEKKKLIPAFRKAISRFITNVGPARLLVTGLVLLAATLVGRFSWQIPILVEAERGFYDMRQFLAAPVVEQDPRILIVVYTEETLAATGKRSPLDRKMLSDALRTLDTMGARSIGIDILIDQKQPEDPELIETFRSMVTPTRLAYVVQDPNDPELAPWQEAYMNEFQDAIAGPKVGPADVRVDVDADNYIRRFPAQKPRGAPLLMDLMASDAGWGGTPMKDYDGGIAFRRPKNEGEDVFTFLPIDLFADPAVAEGLAPLVAGRLVLIGGDLSMIDRFETPISRITGQDTPGVAVHAHLLAQRLDENRLTILPPWAFWASAIIVVLAGALTSISPFRIIISAIVGLTVVGVLVGIPFFLQMNRVDTIGVPAVGSVIAFMIGYGATAASARAIGLEQRAFAQNALGKYLPPDVAQMILDEPEKLRLHGEKRRIYALFTDIEGFTKLSDSLPAEQLGTLLNTYLDDVSRIILNHGGTIDKFVGDAVIAFWGAPFAREDDAERALAAARAIQKYSDESLKRNADVREPCIGRTRIGVHLGKAVVGNFGGNDRIQYTALGDAMNTAARLEAANKATGTYTMVSREAIAGIKDPVCRCLGRITLRGRSDPIEVYEPIADEKLASEHNGLWRRFEAGDAAALQGFRALAAANPDDTILARMITRLESLQPGGTYVVS
jgi:adenylate cyclase